MAVGSRADGVARLRRGSAGGKLTGHLAAEAITAPTNFDRALIIDQAWLLPHFTDGETVAGATAKRGLQGSVKSCGPLVRRKRVWT